MALREAPSVEQFRSVVGDNATELAQIAPALRRVFPGLPPPLHLPPQETRRYLFQSVTDTFMRVARMVPILLVLDDLQWADEASLALLLHLAYRVTRMRLMVAVTYRDIELDHSSALARTLEQLLRNGSISQIKLRGLGESEVALMLRGLSLRDPPGHLVKIIFDETQGNPFFIEELYKYLVEEGKVFDASGQFRLDVKIGEVDVPDKIRLVVGRRLDRLGKSGRQILTAAAIIGRSFGFKLLQTVLSHVDVDDLLTAIEEAERLGLVVSSSESTQAPFQFSHELIRQTLLADASLPRRQLLHLRVADAIEKAYAEVMSDNAVEIANHLSQAGSLVDGQRLALHLEAAGKKALEGSAYEEALRHFQSALSRQSALAKRAELLAYVATAERGLERWDAALANLGEALEIYLRLGDREMIGRSFTESADALIFAGRIQQGIEMARRGLAYLESGVSVDRVRLLASLGHAYAAVARHELADEAMREALDLASRLSDPKLMASVLGNRSIVNFNFFRLPEAAEDGFRSEQLGGSESPPWQRALQLRVLHQTLMFLGRPAEAARIADELEPLARKLGQIHSVALCILIGAWAECGTSPDLAKFETVLRQVTEFNQDARYLFWEVLSEVQMSLVNFFRGDWASSLLHAQASSRHEPGISMGGLGVGTLFRQMAYTGDRAGAFALLHEKCTWLPLSGQPNTRGSWWMLGSVIEGLVILGEHAQAAQLYPLARELIDIGAIVLWPIFRFTRTVAGIAAAAARQWEAAEDHFQIAMRQAESFPHRLEITEINRFHAAMLLDRNALQDRERARGLLNAALDGYTPIGMPRHVEMTRALLDRCGG
jgi:tetratricopeptide (TPR) repeat protein